MENKYIVHDNYKPESTFGFNNYGEAITAAINCAESATITDATTGAILYVTYAYGDTRVFITTVNGEVRITETK
jgi:hypothetical protein